MTQPIRIVVADDHPLLRQGVVLSLIEHGGFSVVAQAGSASEAIAAVDAHLPDIALLDVSMPGNGLKAAATMSKQFPAVGIVMLTVSEDDEDLFDAIRAGARGYVLKGASALELTDVLVAVAGGASYVSPKLAAKVIAALQGKRARRLPEFETLSERELEILRLVAEGMSNKEIARAIDLQEKTVKHYMTNIMQKMQVRNRVEAAIKAREFGV